MYTKSTQVLFCKSCDFVFSKCRQKTATLRNFAKRYSMFACIDQSKLTQSDFLNDPRFNKELAFTVEERQQFGLYGLLPPQVKSQEEQIKLCKLIFKDIKTPTDRYMFLDDLQKRNEKLFYRYLRENIEELMPYVYTPTVGIACQNCGMLYRRPKGLFITINDRGHVIDVLKNWPNDKVAAIVVTDGERILGLGDLGACGMGIPVGKLALYTAIGHVKPEWCLPVTLDVGTNNEKFLKDPHYYGLRQKRVRGPQYDEFLDEFMAAVVERYGQKTLIQFEDFGNKNAFRLLAKYRNKYCTFNDDIQGTAAVCLAALLTCERITFKKFSENTMLFLGAGQAAVGVADLCLRAMEIVGLRPSEARKRIWLFDKHGLISKGREASISPHQLPYVKDHPHETNFLKLIKEIKPTILIGASTVAGAFTPEVLKTMGAINENPIIFALSNPTSKAECTPAQAYEHTEGRAIYCSGSPFDPVNYKGTVLIPCQSNNSYIFPGLALSVILAGIQHVTDELFIIAAHAMANIVPEENLKHRSILPHTRFAPICSHVIAREIFSYAYCKGIATLYPQPKNTDEYIKSRCYNHDYCDMVPTKWSIPHASPGSGGCAVK